MTLRALAGGGRLPGGDDSAAGLRGTAGGGLALASFAEAGLPLDSAGQPLYPIIAWYDGAASRRQPGWKARSAG